MKKNDLDNSQYIDKFTLERPTSLLVARAWRFKEDSVTLSKSIILIFRTPLKLKEVITNIITRIK